MRIRPTFVHSPNAGAAHELSTLQYLDIATFPVRDVVVEQIELVSFHRCEHIDELLAQHRSQFLVGFEGPQRDLGGPR